MKHSPVNQIFTNTNTIPQVLVVLVLFKVLFLVGISLTYFGSLPSFGFSSNSGSGSSSNSRCFFLPHVVLISSGSHSISNNNSDSTFIGSFIPGSGTAPEFSFFFPCVLVFGLDPVLVLALYLRYVLIKLRF